MNMAIEQAKRKSYQNTDLADLTHYRYALAVKPFAVSRHCVVFYPYTDVAPERGRYPGDFDMRSRAIDVVASLVSDALQKWGNKPIFPQIQASLLKDRSIVMFAGEWEGFKVRIKADVHAEYYTITYILDSNPLDYLEKCSTIGVKGVVEDFYYDLWVRFDDWCGGGLSKILPQRNEYGMVKGELIGDIR